MGVTLFYNRIRNTIGKTNVETESGLKVKRISLQGTRVVGVESALTWTATEALRLDGSVTWSRPRSFTEAGTQKLDEKPGWLGTGKAQYSFPLGLSVLGQARYTGNTYARVDEEAGRAFRALPSALVLNARLAYGLSSMTSTVDGELYARVDNLTDETDKDLERRKKNIRDEINRLVSATEAACAVLNQLENGSRKGDSNAAAQLTEQREPVNELSAEVRRAQTRRGAVGRILREAFCGSTSTVKGPQYSA